MDPQQRQQEQQSAMYRPYVKATLVAPMFHIMLEPCMSCVAPIIGCLARVRWILTRPLEFRVLPKWIPMIPLPYLRDVSYVTLGEVFLLLPLVVLMLYGYSLGFVRPDVTESGQIASYAIYITLLTANKSNNLVSIVLGIPFDRLLSYHMLCSFVAIVLGCFHTYAGYTVGKGVDDSQYTYFGSDPNFTNYLGDGTTNLTGTLLLVFMISTVLVSVVPLRRIAFQLWLVSHILLALASIVVCFLHNVTTVVFVLLWWILDLAVRYVVMAGWRYRSTEASLTICHGGEVDRSMVQVRFPKPVGFEYAPGQFVQVAIPAVSVWEFHPVSICSAPYEDHVTIMFRGLGNWTNAVIELAKVKSETTILLEGPYGVVGADLDDVHRYKTVLLVAGGIGSTVCESVGRSLIHQHETKVRTMTKIRYVWAVRKAGMVQDMPPLGGYPQPSTYVPGESSTTTMTNSRPLDVHVDVYTTRKEEDNDNDTAAAADIEETQGLGEIVCIHENQRPDFHAILGEMRAEAIKAGEMSVAVIGCGPDGMMYSLREACRKQSDMAVGCNSQVVFFDLHTERFEF